MKKKNKDFTKKLILLLITLLLIGGLSYYIGGLVLSCILTVGLLLCIIVGQFFDKTTKKSKKRKILKKVAIVILILGIIGILLVAAFSAYIVMNAPDFETELLKKKEVTVLYDKNGNEFAKLGEEIRENIKYDEASEVFIDALIATEDSRFFQHNGVDIMRFIKASIGQVMSKIIHKGNPGGGSTLTMQVSKNTYTDNTAEGIKGIIRKFTDIYVSIFQLEKNYTKQEIIEFYINNHTLNNGTISGVQEASRHYFNKDAKDLSLAEASLIAGMYQAPATYDPYYNPKNATARRESVLYLMVRHGYITEEEAKIASSIPVESLLTGSKKSVSPYQGYINYVCDEIEERYGVNPYQTPMLVYTNMDIKKQEDVYKIMTTENKKIWRYEKLEGGVVVLDSKTGKIEAIGAGRNTVARGFSYATDLNRQPGSTAKPLFEYGPGMEYYNWSTYTLFDDEEGYTYSSGQKINNYDGKFLGIITLKDALSGSRNVTALKAFQSIDNKKIAKFVTSIGIRAEISNGYVHEAHSIGSFTGCSPLELAGAYQIFSNSGYYQKPYSVSKVVFRNTNETDEYAPKREKVISDSTAFMMTDVLREVDKDNAVISALRKTINDDFAMKTGTTNVDSATIKKLNLPADAIRDTWAVGYTHDTVVSVWLGFDQISSNKSDEYLNFRSVDTNLRKQLFADVATKVFKHDNIKFTQPSSVVKVKVEMLSDPPKLPGPNTPEDQIQEHYFKVGTEPTEVSQKYIALATPTDFKVRFENNKVRLSWNKVVDEGYVSDKRFGYYIYYNDNLQGFVTENSTVINTLSDYRGTYAVVAGYEDTEGYRSQQALFELKETNVYNLSITPKRIEFIIGETINKNYYNGGIIELLCNGNDVTKKADIEITILDRDGNRITTISNESENIYTITYRIIYKDFVDVISNTIIVKNSIFD